MKIIITILTAFILFTAANSQDDFADPISRSDLTEISLPNGAFLIREQNVPANFQKLFKNYFAADPAFRQGRSEFIVFKAGSGKGRGQVETALRNAGWSYEFYPPEQGITLFTAVKKIPVRKNILGYWLPVEGDLILALTEVLTGQNADGDADSKINNQNGKSGIAAVSNQSSSDTKTFELSASEQNVNVMGNQLPPMPTFPALPKKKGKIRGYVKDSSGNFLKGAAIGLGSIRVGSSRLVTETVTDAKGYYELDLPLNSANFHYAAYALDYDSGRAAMTLHPSDGDINDNPPIEGGVENFVLLSYGIADKGAAAENSNWSSSYYGGAIALFINMALPGADFSVNRGSFAPGSILEITLTPIGKLIDGSSSNAFIIRKKLDENTRNEFFINNIPVGKYRLTVRSGGKAVGMRQRLPENSVFGIKPTEASGEATILFYPKSGNPTEIGAGSGSWNQVEIYLESPGK